MAPTRDWISWLSVMLLAGVAGTWPADPASAQTQTAAPPPPERALFVPAMRGTSSIAVRVVSDTTGRPVPGATVMAILFADAATLGPSPASTTFTRSAVTDRHGRALLVGLAKGRARLSVSHQGFLSAIYGQEKIGAEGTYIPLQDETHVDDVTVRLMRGGAVGGQVLDEVGDPIIGVQVQVFRRQFVQGADRFARFGVDETDDRGIYRVANLVPGQYIVGVVPRYFERDAASPEEESLAAISVPSADAGGSIDVDRLIGIEVAPGRMAIFSPWSPPPLVGEGGRMIGHAPTFYPGTTSSITATAITIGLADAKSGLDFRLHTATLTRVAGYVVDPAGQAPDRTTLVLRPQTIDERISDVVEAQSTAGAGGAFSFSFVPSGAYTIEARSVWKPPTAGPDDSFRTLAANLPVTVGDDPVDDFAVRLSEGVTFSGRVQPQGGAALSSLAGFSVLLRTQGTPALGAITVRAVTDEDGRFSFDRLPAGRYTLALSDGPTGWHATSVIVDGRDILDDAVMVTQAVDDVVVSIATERTEIRGTVRDGKGRATSSGWVIVFPVNRSDWSVTRRVAATRPNADGSFEINALPAGQYLIAIADAEAGQWRDPGFLEQIQVNALALSLGPGEKTTRALTRR